MIPVEPQPEPDDFDEKVRQPGLTFLQKNPDVSASGLKPTWRNCLDDLHETYDGICAYMCTYISRVSLATTDHFICKSDPEQGKSLAYEWANYRLACSLMNSRKGRFDDVLDPFEIEDGWFVLEITSGKIFPSPDLEEQISERVQETIDRLKLNDPRCRQDRTRYLDEYFRSRVSFDFLERYFPLGARAISELRE